LGGTIKIQLKTLRFPLPRPIRGLWFNGSDVFWKSGLISRGDADEFDNSFQKTLPSF
jgi:hypothetical protein